MRRRITLLLMAFMMALALSFGGATAAFAGPDCAPPDKNNCVANGGQWAGSGSTKPPGQTNNPNPGK